MERERRHAAWLWYGLYAALSAGSLAYLALAGHAARLAPTSWRAGAAEVGLGLASGLLVAAFTRLGFGGGRGARWLSEEFLAVAARMGPGRALSAAALSGIAEELFFRGVLQPAVGVWMAAACFALIHLGPDRRFVLWAVVAWVAGLLLGWLFEWTGHLAAPVTAHVAFNYLNLRLFSHRRQTGP